MTEVLTGPARRTVLALAFAAVVIAISAGCTVGTSEDETEDQAQGTVAGLTRQVPTLVSSVCEKAKSEVTVAVVCPPLVPRTRLATHADLSGVIVYFPDARLYLLTFNNGDVGPGYLHWLVGKGDRDSVERNLLRDDANVVKGLPRLLDEASRDGRTVRLYEYPSHPAGGVNGGHVAAFIDCGAEIVVASVHDSVKGDAAEEIALSLAEEAECPS